ncbi:hypothetical protein [Chroococcidiopsis sp.]|uniref:hypothetical protein n=1 Tax=Chroococcidiopsis sp. TaxID=3088168 RepID=UPI003F311543
MKTPNQIFENLTTEEVALLFHSLRAVLELDSVDHVNDYMNKLPEKIKEAAVDMMKWKMHEEALENPRTESSFKKT